MKVNSKEYQEMQRLTGVLSDFMRIEPLIGTYKGGYHFHDPASYVKESELAQKFFSFVSDQMKGESWYFYPEFDNSFDWQAFVYRRISNLIKDYVSSPKCTDFQDDFKKYEKFLEKHSDAYYNLDHVQGMTVLGDMIAWYNSIKNK